MTECLFPTCSRNAEGTGEAVQLYRPVKKSTTAVVVELK